ncbi:MAG: flagellar hook-associated protein FlgK [Planctomycetota bacterium]|nr:flagellar hook-associated protein FlgK [Planctomycetota bacterium]
MSLTGALQIGRSTLTASQAALQVAGNNMANAATPGFHRRSVNLAPVRGEYIGNGQFVGRGVNLQSVKREYDSALQARMRNAIGDQNSALIDQRFLIAIETIQNELTDNDISSLLSEFFNSFSELANDPDDNAIRSLVIQQGQTLAGRLQDLKGDYNDVRDQIDRALGAGVSKINDLLNQIGQINGNIAVSEASGGQENALRDQRDLLVDELAKFIDVTQIDQPNGSINLLVGSMPVLIATDVRGVELRREIIDGEPSVSLRIAADGSFINAKTGELGALMNQRDTTVTPVLDDLDVFTSQLIFQVNRVHSQGQGSTGFSSVKGSYSILDSTVSLNSNLTGLPYKIDNGSFFIHVTDDATGQRTTHRIDIDGNDLSLDDLINEINVVVGVPSVTASKGAANQLVLTAAAGAKISFSDDTSGALAALGLNTFFTGSDATSIEVNQRLRDNPRLLAAASQHIAGSNDTALAIADLQDLGAQDLNGSSLREFWNNSVNDLAVKTNAANRAVESTGLIKASLSAQVQAVSGVSIDEEAINMLTFQRQFQAGARFIQTIDEMLQTLLSIV